MLVGLHRACKRWHMERRVRHLTPRCFLLVALSLSSSACATARGPTVASSVVPGGPSAEDVGRTQYAGDAPAALALAELAAAARPGDAPTRLAGTCAAIEANQLGRASALLAPLERASPVHPRVAVLRHLVDRRTARPEEPLMLALAAAWHLAGRPDLSEDEPALARPSTSPPPALQPRGAAERLLFEPPDDREELAALAIEASHRAEGLPVAVGLQVLGALSNLPCPADAGVRNGAVARSRLAAERALPGNGYVALASLLARCPLAWTSREVDELSRIAGSPILSLPRERAFDEILTMAQTLDPATARRRAISAWLALDVAAYELQRLTQETLPDPSLRVSAGRSLEAIGASLADSTAWLERMVGLALTRRGSWLAGREDAGGSAARCIEPKRHVYQVWSTLLRRRGQWPFAAEWREWTPDEVGRAMEFLEAVGEAPGVVQEGARR